MKPFPLILSALLLAGAFTNALAQAYPTRPLKIVTPLTPGAASDQTARLVADKLKDRLGQPVLVEARVGGGGVVAVDYVLKQPADGYTFLLHSVSMATAPTVNPNAKYDPIRDFVAVGTVNMGLMVLSVNPEVPVKSVAEYVAYAKANPSKVNHGVSALGNLDHLAIEILMRDTGMKVNVIPYKGGASATADLLGGRLQSQIDSLVTMGPHIASGKMRGLGVTAGSRLPSLPNVPSIAETDAGFEVLAWYGLYAPTGIPREAVTRVNAELAEVNKLPEIIERNRAMGYAPLTTTPEQHAAMLLKDMTRLNVILKELNIRME